MKTKIMAVTAAVAMTLAAGAALAQQTDRPARGMRADADGDGRISQAEFVDGRVARLSAVDANRDGSVNAEEMRSGRDTRRNQRASAGFERLDANGDGSLSRDEFMTRHGIREGRGGGRGNRAEARGPVSLDQVRTRSTETFARLDADSDGYLTQGERRQGMRGHGRRGGRGHGQWGSSPSAPASE